MIALSTPHLDVSMDMDDSFNDSMTETQMSNDTKTMEHNASLDDSIVFLKEVVNLQYGKYQNNMYFETALKARKLNKLLNNHRYSASITCH